MNLENARGKALVSGRMGDWIQTYTVKQFWTIDPRAEEIDIEDIAHALGMMCRYNGHCEEFYSVGEHSVLIARHLLKDHSPTVRLWGLLHDASEAYIADINRPTKPYLSNYKVLEANIMACVCKRFQLPLQEPPEVKAADNAILFEELMQNMKPSPAPWSIDYVPIGVKLEFWTPKQAKLEFLKEYESIIFEMSQAA